MPYPSWRANGRKNLEHDNTIRDWFWGSAEDGDAPFMQRPGIGRVVTLHLRHDRKEFTFHSPRGDHASIDHVFSDHASAAYTSGVPRTPVFLGSRTDGHDDFACLDHRAILVSIREGEMEATPASPTSTRLSKRAQSVPGGAPYGGRAGRRR